MTDPRYKLEYGTSRLIRYCGKRLRFFDGLHKLSLFIGTVAGSSAFVTIISDKNEIAAWLTGIVAIVSSLDNVIGFSERARHYSELRSRYYDLYCEIVKCSARNFREEYFREQRLQIDRDKPPTLRVLDVISRNEEDIARGYDVSETRYINFFRKAMRHIFDLPPDRWVTISEHKNLG